MLLLLVSMLALLLSCGQAQEYHYPRPQIPFHLSSPHPQQPQQLPANRFIVQTLGPHGRTYELQMHKAPMVYTAHQTYNVPQQQQQQHLPHHQPHQGQQLHTSVLQNPLLVNSNFQQQQQQQLQPVVPPVSDYGQPQASFPPTAPAQSVASYYRQPQALTVATAAQAHFEQAQQQQQQQQQQPHFSNPQPYALVTLPNGERVLDAGHGSGTPPADSSLAGVGQRVADFAAQSPVATLDTYNYKQAVPGDTRSFQRYVNNCQANGQCQQLTLNPGQIDGDHQQLLLAARSRTQPAASCKKNAAYVPPGAQVNEQGQLRPRGRRTNVHVQEQLAKYPYN